MASLHHLSFCDADNVPLSIRLPPRISMVWLGKVYAVLFPGSVATGYNVRLHRGRHVLGHITNIASFSATIGTLQFTPDIHTSRRVSSLPLHVGMECQLLDKENLGGTAMVAGWTDAFVTFTNLSAGFEVSISSIFTS